METSNSITPVTLLKLGGSLITDKETAFSSQRKRINRIAREIREALQQDKNLKIIIGHGSGSFGHVAARQYHTREGVTNTQEWLGFAEVWFQARKLNQIVIESLYQQDLPIIAFPPSASVITNDGKVQSWDLSPLFSALENCLIPIIQGDVIFDNHLGGTILSTEELFLYLADKIPTKRILLAGIEKGVWIDYPNNTKLVDKITPASYPSLKNSVKASSAVDVTGGMLKKVQNMIELVEKDSSKQSLIFSGVKRDNVLRALLGKNPGTLIAKP